MAEQTVMDAFDVNAWLHQPIEDGGEPRWRRLAYLVTANGGLSVYGWGFLSFHAGHRRGLEQDEALELIAFKGFCDGLTVGGVDVYDAFLPLFRDYLKEFATNVEEGEDHIAMQAEKRGGDG